MTGATENKTLVESKSEYFQPVTVNISDSKQ